MELDVLNFHNSGLNKIKGMIFIDSTEAFSEIKMELRAPPIGEWGVNW